MFRDLDHILVGTDFSAASAPAFAIARRLAAAHGARVTLMHVIEDRPDAPGWTAPPVSQGEVLELLEEHAARELDDATAAGADDVAIAVASGIPHEALTRFALDEDADLIIVGRVGVTPLERMLLGSTAERLIRHAAVDVLVATGATGPWSRVLAPVDFSDHSNRAADLAAGIAADEGAVLDVLHINEFSSVADVPTSAAISERFQASMVEQSATDLKRVCDRLRAADPAPDHVVQHVRSGPAAAEILEHARDTEAELIVAATLGRTGLQRLLVGSTVERIARETPCALLALATSPHPDDA